MKAKRYFLYLLILIVAGVIIVSIFYAVRDRQKNNISEAGAASPVDVTDEVRENTGEGQDTPEAGISEDEAAEIEGGNNADYYKSSSGDFDNYGFILPEGWALYEENSGKRVLLKGTGSNNSLESIMIMVEDGGQFESLTPVEEIIDKYMQIKEEDGFNGEIIDNFYTKIGKIENEVHGYFYDSGLKAGEEAESEETCNSEIDLFTCLTSGEDVYIAKYMSSGVEKNRAVETFRRFLSDFSIGAAADGSAEEDKSGSINILVLGVDSGLGREWSRENAVGPHNRPWRR